MKNPKFYNKIPSTFIYYIYYTEFKSTYEWNKFKHMF